jgi:hypothetical protein
VRPCNPALLLALVLLAAPSRATVIFDTFGPGDAYQPNAGIGLGIVAGHTETIQGAAFTPAADARLGAIELAAATPFGVNELRLWLMTDVASAPGVIIEELLLTGLSTAFPGGSVVRAESSLQPLLTAGNPYWLIAAAALPRARRR